MKMVIQCNDYKTIIEPEGKVTMSEVYEGIRIETEQGGFSVCERDGSIEVNRIHGQKGTRVYNGSTLAWKLPPPNDNQAVENPERALSAWREYAQDLERKLEEA